MKFTALALAATTFIGVNAAEPTKPEYVVAVVKRVATIVHPGLANIGPVRRQNFGWESFDDWNDIASLDDVDEECISALSTLSSDFNTNIPTDTSFLSALATYAAQNDIDLEEALENCYEDVEVTGSLSSAFSSYSSAWSSYFSEYSSIVEPAVSACSEDSAITAALLLPYEDTCSAIGEDLSSAAPAGPREAGIIFAAMAGIIGMMAVAM